MNSLWLHLVAMAMEFIVMNDYPGRSDDHNDILSHI